MTTRHRHLVGAAVALCLAGMIGWVACASHVSGAFSFAPRASMPGIAVIGPGLVPTTVRSDAGSVNASRLYYYANVPQVIGIVSEAVIFATDSGIPQPGVPSAVTACKEPVDQTIPAMRWLSAEYPEKALVLDLCGVRREVVQTVLIGDSSTQMEPLEFYICTPDAQWLKVGTRLPIQRLVEFSDYVRVFAASQCE